MSDERRGDGGGAAIAVVIIIVILGFVGLLGLGGVGAMFYVRSSQMAQLALVQEAQAREEAERAYAEMMSVRARAEMTATAADVATAQSAPAEKPAEEVVPEVLLEINAAGDYKLGEKTLSFEELKDALLAEHFDKGPNLLVVITAQPATPYKRVSQALEAAECASITKTKLRNAPEPPK